MSLYKVGRHPLTIRLRRLADRASSALVSLWRKPGVRTGLVLLALAAIAFNAFFFHIAAMPEGIFQPATDEHYTIDPAYHVYLNGELPPRTYTYGPVLPLLLGYASVVVTLLRIAVFGLPIQALAGVEKTELVFYGRLWNAGIMALTSLLVFWMAYQATRRRSIGLCVALLFSFGSYVVRLAKPDVTSGLFALAAVTAAAGYLAQQRFRPARLSLALATVLMVLACFTKYTAVEFVVILPFAVVVKAWRERREQPAWIQAIVRDLLIVASAGLVSTLLLGQISFFKNQDHYRSFTASLTVQAATAYKWTQEGRTAWANWLRLDFWRQKLNIYSVSTTGSIAFTFLCVAATVRYLFSRQPILSILAAGTFFTLLRALGRTVRVSDVELIAAGLVILGAIFVFELGGWLTRLVVRLARGRSSAGLAWQRLAPVVGAIFSGVLVALIYVSAIRTQDRPHYALSRAISQVLEQCPGLKPEQVWFGLYDDRDFSPAWMSGVHFYTTYGADSTEKMLSDAAPLSDAVLVLRPLDPDPRVNLLSIASKRIWLAGNYTVLEFGNVNCVPSVPAHEIADMSATNLGRVFGGLNAISLDYKRALYALLPPGVRPDFWPRNEVLEPGAFVAARYESLANSLKRAVAAPDQYANTLAVLRDYYAANSSEESPQVRLIQAFPPPSLAAGSDQGNAVANSSFELSTAEASGLGFVGWQTATFWNSAKAQGAVRSTTGFNSDYALELEMTEASGSPDRIGLQQDCGLFAAGTSLLLQADINVLKDLINASARVDAVIYLPGSTSGYSILSINRMATTNGWHTSTAVGRAPAAAGQYSCMIVAQLVADGPISNVSNTAQFDNIVLRSTVQSP
jgi:hypothetical protein